MKQYVSRRRRSWTLLVQIVPVIHHLSEGNPSDMPLDLGGLQSVTNETLTELPKLSSSNIHVSTSERVKD